MRTRKRLIVGMLILALLLASVPVASARPARQAIPIAACQTLTAGDYILTANIPAVGTGVTCFPIVDDNVTFDGGGFTITLTAGGLNQAFAVYDGAVVAPPAPTVELDSVSITNVNVTTSGVLTAVTLDFVDVTWVHNFSMTNSTFTCDAVDLANGWCAVDMLDLDRVRNSTIDECTFTSGDGNAINVGPDVFPVPDMRSNEVTISNNTIVLPDLDGIHSDDTHNLTIAGNDISGSVTTHGVHIRGGTNLVVSGNASYNNNIHGLLLEQGTVAPVPWRNATIGPGNDFYGNTQDGIRVIGDGPANVDTLTITGNHIYQNTQDGIELQGVNTAVISDNVVERNTAEGLHLDGAVALANANVTVGTGNEFSANGNNGVLVDTCTTVTVDRNTVTDNGLVGVMVMNSDATVLRNWIELNRQEGVRWDNNVGPVVGHGNLICNNCLPPSVGCPWGAQVEVTNDGFAPLVDFEHNFYCDAPIPSQFDGGVDYSPWLSVDVTALSTVPADGTSFATLTASIMGGVDPVTLLPYEVADGVPISFGTDLGWFDRAMRQDVRPAKPTLDGVVTAKIYSDVPGFATVTAMAYADIISKARLVEFTAATPAKPSITYPPHRSTITERRPKFEWTASDGAVYQVKLRRLRPRPKATIFDTITDKTSYKSQYLDGRKYKLKVRACTDTSLTLCSPWSRAKFKIE